MFFFPHCTSFMLCFSLCIHPVMGLTIYDDSKHQKQLLNSTVRLDQSLLRSI